MYALLMPELDTFVHGLMQFRAWAGAQKQCIYRQKSVIWELRSAEVSLNQLLLARERQAVTRKLKMCYNQGYSLSTESC